MKSSVERPAMIEELESPLSTAQLGVWFAQQISGSQGNMSVASLFTITGALDESKFEDAMRLFFVDADSSRVRIAQLGGEIIQSIVQPEQCESSFRLIDASEENDPEATVRRWAEDDLQTGVDLSVGPLFLGVLFRLAPERYACYLRAHHIVCDGYSMFLWASRLAKSYTELVAGCPISSTPLGSLSTLIEDEAAYRQSVHFQRDRDFWRGELEQAPRAVTLAVARQTKSGRSQKLSIDMELAPEMREIARGAQGEPSHVMFALLLIYLHRMTGAEDIVVGLPVSARVGKRARSIVGCTANVIPLRLRIDPNKTIIETIQQVAEKVGQVLRRQRYRLEDIQRDSGRAIHGQPLFRVIANYFAFDHEMDFDGNPGSLETLSTGMIEDVNFEFSDYREGSDLRIRLIFNSGLYSAEEMAAHRDRFAWLMQAAANDPGQRVHELNILPDAERERVLYSWNRTEVEHPAHLCVHELFEQQVERDPASIAIVCEDGAFSYDELNKRANRLAHYLRELGVKPDDRIALCIERGLEMIVALLAVLKAGGAYVPLDPTYPPERLRFMLEDSAPTALLTQSSLQNQFVKQSQIVILDLNEPTWNRYPEANPGREAVGLTPQHLAYVIYTSGSTGIPKGVMVQHSGLINVVSAQLQIFNAAPGSRILQFASICFDASVFEVLMAICRGASLHIPRPGEILSGEVLLNRIARNQITHITLPPAVLATIKNPIAFESVRMIVTAGETLTQSLAAKWGPGRRLLNAYGPTEATIWATIFECQSDNPGMVPIGRPITNTKIYILDAHGKPVPIGVTGEIYIGGVGVARGYLNRPNLTAERFLEDPFVADGRMYKTGDLGRWTPDGNIEFLGRNDFQVKLRGFRFELGEIETRLAACAGVREAAVILREDVAGEKRLLAYYVPSEERKPINVVRLRSQLSDALPEYMLPAVYVCLERMPLTLNGKLDHNRLPEPDFDAYSTAEYEDPQGKTEGLLAAVFAGILKVDRVGRHDNFFSLGGHSMNAVKVVSLLSEKGVNLAISDLFREQTVAAIAPYCSSLPRQFNNERAILLRKGTGKSSLFLVHDGSGDVGYAHVLSQHMDPLVSIYGLPAASEARGDARSIEHLAARLIELIRDTQPVGPYSIAGWSFGGMLAYEIALQLTVAGEEIEFLALLDTIYFPGVSLPIQQVVWESKDDRAHLMLHVRNYITSSKSVDAEMLSNILQSSTETDFGSLVRRCLEASALPLRFQDRTVDEIRRQLRREQLYYEAAGRYTARPIQVPIHLFRAEDAIVEDPLLGWHGVISDKQILSETVPGNHYSILQEPHIETLARALSQAMSQEDPVFVACD